MTQKGLQLVTGYSEDIGVKDSQEGLLRMLQCHHVTD